MERHYKPNEFAKLLNVSVLTLQRWDRLGKLKAFRTPTDRRYYTHNQYLEYTGLKTDIKKRKGKTVIYARVSKTSQKYDLNNQIKFLQDYMNTKGLIVDEIVEDYGSNLNYNRQKWNKLLDECILGEVETIVISHKDRFVRFGYDCFERLLFKFGVNIIVVNNEKVSL
ncbi:hypothetical protein AN641_03550 [Candidatus Epulonipiscioides gigas]|nr:hypothetical protein AN641_03550 [Epulopiscium sp. SCG-C07WGA-EpuloA2]